MAKLSDVSGEAVFTVTCKDCGEDRLASIEIFVEAGQVKFVDGKVTLISKVTHKKPNFGKCRHCGSKEIVEKENE